MQTPITEQEFEKKAFDAGDTVDFVAKCITPWHLIGVKAFIEKLIEKKKTVRGYIFIRYHGLSGYVIKETDLVFPQEASLKLFWGKKSTAASGKEKMRLVGNALFKGKHKPSNGQTPIYILNAFYPDYGFCSRYMSFTNRPCVPVCIDEGVGTYKSRLDLFGEKWRRSKKGAVLNECRQILNDLEGTKMPEKTIQFTILTATGRNKLIKNSEVIPYYKRTLQNNRTPLSICDEQYILVLTQPFELKEEKDAEKSVNAAFDSVIKEYSDKGYRVFVKPHPREKAEAIAQYREKGYSIVDQAMPVEKLLNCLNTKPACVIGALSTALVTASILCDTNAISVADAVGKTSNKAYTKQAKLFKERYGEFVTFAE